MDRPSGLGAEWDELGKGQKWADFPGALQAAVTWAWKCAGPETPNHWARLEALDGHATLEEILSFEGIRWTGNLVKRALHWLKEDEINQAVGEFFCLSASAIRWKRNSSGNPWNIAAEAERRIDHKKHERDYQQRECKECKWTHGIGPGAFVPHFLIPRMDGSKLSVQRIPFQKIEPSCGGNREVAMFTTGGWSIQPDSVWYFSVHLPTDDGQGWESEPLRRIEFKSTQQIKDATAAWAELFRICNPKLIRIYLRRPDGSFFPQPTERNLLRLQESVIGQAT